MQDKYNNKQIGNTDFKSSDSLKTKDVPTTTPTKATGRRFFFPADGLNFVADTLEEATQKLKDYQSKSNKS